MSEIIKSEGIVFRTLKYSETSLILDIYSNDHGIGSYIISGVRKSKSKLANLFHPMNIIDFVAYHQEDKLSRIKEASFHYTYDDMYNSIVKSSIGLFIIDLARNAIKEKEAQSETYHLIKQFLMGIDKGTVTLKYAPLNFAVEFAAHMGFELYNNYSDARPYFDLTSGSFVEDLTRSPHCIDAQLSHYLSHIIAGNPDIQIPKESRSILLDKMVDFYKFHISGFRELKSVDVIRTILS